jgi:hypothetical protein
MLVVAGAWSAILGLPAGLGLLLRRADRRYTTLAAMVFLAVPSVLVSFDIYWLSTLRPLPIVMIVFAGISVVRLFEPLHRRPPRHHGLLA